MVWVQALLGLGMLLAASPQETAPGMPADLAEDFENRATLNIVYDDWAAVARPPEYPAYNQISLVNDPSAARSRRHFVRFRLHGQNAAFRMTPRAAWRIQDATRSFRFSGWIRLTGSRRNQAYFSIEWQDAAFRTLREDRSPALHRPGAWTEVTVDIPSIPSRTEWVTIGLNCGGPDVRATCDFDHVVLASRPRILFERMMPDLPGPAIPRFRITASGFPSGDHEIEIVSQDLWGRIAGRSGSIPIASGVPTSVDLPRHPPGFYEIHLTLSGPGGPLERRIWPLALPNDWVFPPGSDGWIGGTFNPWATRYPDATALSRLAGFRDARVVLWGRGAAGRADVPAEDEILALVREVSRVPQMSVTGVLAAPPTTLFPGLDPAILDRDPRSLFQLTPSIWEQPFRDTALRYWELIPRWEFMGDGEADRAIAALKDVSSRAVVAPESPEMLELPPRPSTGQAGARDQVARLLRLLIEQRAAGVTAPRFASLESSGPGTLLDREGYSRAPLMALRAVNDLLAGASPRPDLRLNDPRLGDFAFEKAGRLVLAVWSVNGSVDKEFNLGQNARLYPPLGAIVPLPPRERVALGPMPAFILDADPFFLQVQQSVHFYDPEKPEAPATELPLQVNASARQIRFRNLFRDETITDVRLRILEVPSPWVMRPLEFRTDSLAGEAEFSGELTFVLPPTLKSESREIPIELSFNRGTTPYSVRISRTIRVTPLIAIHSSVAPVAGDPGARQVTISITNDADRPVSLAARVRLPGLPEQVVAMGRLESKATAPRRLRYVVRGLDGLPPERRVGEVICEERGGRRLHTREKVDLR